MFLRGSWSMWWYSNQIKSEKRMPRNVLNWTKSLDLHNLESRFWITDSGVIWNISKILSFGIFAITCVTQFIRILSECRKLMLQDLTARFLGYKILWHYLICTLGSCGRGIHWYWSVEWRNVWGQTWSLSSFKMDWLLLQTWRPHR